MNARVSGLFSVIGLVVYPVGWGTKRVRDLCGEYADPYVIDSCSIGEFCTIFEFYVIVSCAVVRYDFYVIVSCKKGVTSNNFTYISNFSLLSIEIISDQIFFNQINNMKNIFKINFSKLGATTPNGSYN